jgi:RHS repeat-associated protein
LILLDPATLQQLGEVALPAPSEIVAVNSSSRRAFLVNNQSGTFSILDLDTRQIVASVTLFERTGPVGIDMTRNLTLIAHDNSLAFVQMENPVPALSGIVPRESLATVDAGIPLAVSGAKFIRDTQTQFNDQTLPARFESNEQLTATIPSSELMIPGNVTVSVNNPPPGGGRSNELTFKILTPLPLIEDVSPQKVASGGKASLTVRVEGKNFLPVSAVRFQGKGVSAKFISSTVLEAVINKESIAIAGSYPVSVTNPGEPSLTSNVAMLAVVPPEELLTANTAGAVSLGSGALVGRMLNTEMQPVKGVTVRFKNTSAVTDEYGNFTLDNLPAGKRTILLDGSTAIEADGHYPVIPISVDITAGVHNPMPFIPYLHRQKSYNFVDINPATETVLTDPEVPGFELRIPKGVNITGWDGKTNIRVSVRTVPVNRLPVKPVPANSNIRTVYMFYFDKVGGGVPDRPIPIKSLNDLGLLPGEKAILWYYDESPNEGEAPNDWAIAGTGTVTDDGQYIVTDPGVGIPKFCCGASAWGGTGVSLPTSCKERCGGFAGDPVDVTTGYFIHEQVDLAIPGIIPVEIKRIYRSRDGGSAVSGGTTGLGAFGKGMSFEYDWWLGTYGAMLRLTKPGSYQYDFVLQGDGSYLNTVDPEFRGAKVTANADATKTLRMRDGRTYKFDASGRLIEIADRNDNKMTLQRHSDFEGGYLQKIITAEGREITFNQTYTGNFFRTDSITLPDGRAIGYTYETDPFNSYPRLKQVEYPDGRTVQYSYDSQGRMSAVTNRRGTIEVTNVYDTNSRVTSQTHPDGGVHAFDYSVAGQTKMTAPSGAQTTWSYNGYGYLTQKITPDGTTTYNKAAGTNQLASVTDPLGRVTSYTYYSTTDAKNGLVNTVTDPLNNITTYDYETTYGLPTKITDPLGKITTITYTPSPLTTPPTQAVINDPLLHATTISYNSFGLPASVTDPNSNTTTLAYDPDKHAELTSVTDALGNSVSYTYDSIGRFVTVNDAKGAKTTYGYDSMDRVNKVTDPFDGTTKYYYDGNGNLAMIIDAKENSLIYEYDDRDRITKMTDQLDRYETYSYYRNAEITATTGENLKSYIDRKGQTTTFNEYDVQNRLKKITFNDGSNIQYSYDAVGRASSINDSIAGIIGYTYNDFGCTSCGGRGLDLISQETTPLSTVNYTYDQDGRRLTMTVAGEPVVTTTWDDAGRLTKINRSVAGTVKDFLFTYDNGGRRTKLQMPLYKSQGKWKYLTSTYGYDIADRLLSLLQQNPTTTIESLTYTYDPNGNRKSFARNATQPLSPSLAGTDYDDANELLTFNGKNLSYDENGNLTTRTDSCGTTNYTWDARNRLTNISGFKPDCSTLSASFSYDALNRRTAKTINSSTTQFIYDGWDIIQESKAGIKTNYVRTLNIDEPLARIIGSTIRHYVRDGLGSVIALTDETGVVKTTYVYDAYGNVTITGEASDNPFQYTGRENDGTGLLHYRLRYYSPEMGRFISEDPIRLLGGMNFFSYVQNNPVNWTDPLGLYWFRQPWQTKFVVGRENSSVVPGDKISRFIENYVPAGRTFGESHDIFVDAATIAGVQDWLVNIPSMVPIYGTALTIEMLRTMGYVDQPNPCKK